MRSLLSSLTLTVSLVFASIGWSGFILTRTAFDPGRSEQLADELLDNEEVRGVLVARLAEAIEAQLPPVLSVSEEQIENLAAQTLDDPRVESLVRDNIVVAHQNALNGVDQPIFIDSAVVTEAAQDAVVAENPQLEGFAPDLPSTQIALPTSGLTWLGPVADLVRQITWISAGVGIAGFALALLVSPKKHKVLRRIAQWAIGAAAFWLVAAFLTPWVAGLLAPDSMALVSAMVNIFFGAMIWPAVTLGVIAIALYLASVIWKRSDRQRRADVRPAQKQQFRQPKPVEYRQQASLSSTPEPYVYPNQEQPLTWANQDHSDPPSPTTTQQGGYFEDRSPTRRYDT